MLKRSLIYLIVSVFVLSSIFLLAPQITFAEKPVIEYWDALTRKPHVQGRNEIIKKFEEETGIEVKVTTMTGDVGAKVRAAAAARTLPDILFLWNAQMSITYAQMGIVAPVTDIVNDIGVDYYSNSRIINRTKLNGDYYGIPFVTYPGIMFYRKDIYDEKGLKPPKTWDEWYDVAKKTTEDTDGDGQIDMYGVVFGIAEDWPYGNLRASNADYWWDENGNDTVGEQTGEVLDFIRKMFDEVGYPGSTTLTNEGQRLAFLAGNAASIVTSTSFLWPLIREKPEWLEQGKVAAAPVPLNASPEEGAGAETGTHTLNLVEGPNKDLAEQFLRFWLREDNLKTYFSMNIPGHLPPFKVVWQSEELWNRNPNFNAIFEAGRKTINQSQWEHPVVSWGDLVDIDLGEIMERVTVDRWSTEKIINALHKGIKNAKASLEE